MNLRRDDIGMDMSSFVQGYVIRCNNKEVEVPIALRTMEGSYKMLMNIDVQHIFLFWSFPPQKKNSFH